MSAVTRFFFIRFLLYSVFHKILYQNYNKRSVPLKDTLLKYFHIFIHQSSFRLQILATENYEEYLRLERR